MSGYLQRLASSVIRPKENVRPLLGSIYSGSMNASAGEPVDKIEHESTRLIPSHTIPPSNEGVSLIEPGDRRGDVVATQEHIQQSDAPLVIMPRERSKGVSPSSATELREEEDPEREYAARPKGIYIPLLTSSSTGVLSQPIARAPEDFSSSVPTRKHTAGTPQSTQRESDEIQIHIGRIEVSAVTQPAPVAVTRTPRTPSSLDEYLQRRDRRRP